MTNYIKPHTILQYAKKHPGSTFSDYGRYVATIKGYTYYPIKLPDIEPARIPYYQQLFAIFKHIFNIK
jgi:hypothetical protein